MHSYSINAFLSGHVFVFLMLLARIGTVMMLFPGIGDRYVPPRIRMVFACLICLILLEPMVSRFPPLPASSAGLAQLVMYEIVIGLFFGTFIRLIIVALEAAGMIVGMQSGLSNATMMNPAQATQSPLPSAFLSLAGLVLIFVTGLDHYLILTTVSLYDVFPPGQPPLLGDMAKTIINLANKSFVMGIQLSAPFLILGLLLYGTIGVMQRLMPSVQLFLILLPVKIWCGLMMFSLSISGILVLWLQFADETVGSLLKG